MGDEKEIFVPGRLCLFGEHSDWAGGHGRQNSEICPGYAIVAQTNQGNYARISKIQDKVLDFNSTSLGRGIRLPLKVEELAKIASEGGEFSYIAGVALEVVSNYNHVHSGIKIENYKSCLPLKKGLSSSASICVLVAKAFNEIFDLKWTERRIMDIAYLGESNTPSRCGRLDQACVYTKPVLMRFEGDRISVDELKVGTDFPILVVDLKKGKDTKKILTDLNRGFPFPSNELESAKHDYLGPINKHLVTRAAQAISHGELERLGALMNEAQQKFDRYVVPSCPQELTAPKLHEILSLPEIKDFIYGGKGVGSQGDGTAQFICKSEQDRKKVTEILTSKGLDCLDLDLKRNF